MGRGAAINSHAMVAVRRRELGHRSTRLAVTGWMRHLADHHPYTARHCTHVARLMDLVCEDMQITGVRRQDMRQCAMLHDLGKLAVPVSLLDGNSRELDDQQWSTLQAHSAEGAIRVASTPELEHYAPVIRAVHERWDGAGYPDGLAGEKIPLTSRILAIVDAFDAMTSPERLYQQPMTHAQALDCLQQNAGSQFDPQLVTRFMAIARRHPQAVRRLPMPAAR